MYPVHISHMVDICLLKVESENHSFSLALICGLNELKVVLQPLKRSLSWGSKSMKMAHGFLSVTSMKSCSWTERGDATMHLSYKWIFRIPSWTHSKRQSVNTFGNLCLCATQDLLKCNCCSRTAAAAHVHAYSSLSLQPRNTYYLPGATIYNKRTVNYGINDKPLIPTNLDWVDLGPLGDSSLARKLHKTRRAPMIHL